MSSSSLEAINEETDQHQDLFTQDGVLLKTCVGRPITELNAVGMLCILDVQKAGKCIEWRPLDSITIDSDSQEQDWAVVKTIGRRQRTFSGNLTGDYLRARARIIRIPLAEMLAFRVTRNNQQLQFSIKPGIWQSTFFFQHGNSESFVANLKSHMKTVKSRQDRNTYMVVESNIDTQALNKSFTALDIYSDNTTDAVWNLVTNFKERPYQTTMEAFSKLTDLVLVGNDLTEKRDMSQEVHDLMTKSMIAIEDATTVTRADEYEVISVKPTLPPRPSIPRSNPLTKEKWAGVAGTEGQVTEVDGVRQLIFRGGVAPDIRKCVWKYLLDYYSWGMTRQEIVKHRAKKANEYYNMKNQYKSITPMQESRFSEYRDRKSLVEKDVNRTDRTLPFYAGDNNKNLEVLEDILMTYVMYNFDLGYVQGMSDILAPLLLLLDNEVDAFWCFVGFMDKIESNFDMDQAGMKQQLLHLQQLLTFVCPELATHLVQKESGNMYFCFRWLLVWFKREFSHIDIMRLWEVLWTGLPCANFHLLICVAILDAEKDTIISRDYGFTEILKHVNELSMRLDVNEVLSTAEGIYHQVISAPHLSNQIRVILGLEPVVTQASSHGDKHEPSTSSANGNSEDTKSNGVTLDADKEEVMYQSGIDNNFY